MTRTTILAAALAVVTISTTAARADGNLFPDTYAMALDIVQRYAAAPPAALADDVLTKDEETALEACPGAMQWMATATSSHDTRPAKEKALSGAVEFAKCVNGKS